MNGNRGEPEQEAGEGVMFLLVSPEHAVRGLPRRFQSCDYSFGRHVLARRYKPPLVLTSPPSTASLQGASTDVEYLCLPSCGLSQIIPQAAGRGADLDRHHIILLVFATSVLHASKLTIHQTPCSFTAS